MERDRREQERGRVEGRGRRTRDADAARLRELGYRQELDRRLGIFDNAAAGFAAISPVVGLYAVVFVGTAVAGPAWVWVLPVALAGQCLLLAVYSELAAEFPIAGGAYQWSRRLVGGAYGWMAGWVAICAYGAANTTIAYLGAPWALTLLGIEPTPGRSCSPGWCWCWSARSSGALGVDVMARVVKAGIAAEAIASVGHRPRAAAGVPRAGLLDLHGDPRAPRRCRAARPRRRCWPRWRWAAGCSSASTPAWAPPRRPATPRATCRARSGSPCSAWAALVILNAVAVTLAHPDPAAVVAGEDIDPVTTAVVTSFGSWSAKPFAAVVLAAFLACGIAAQALTARADLLDRARRRAARLARSCAGWTAARPRSGRSWSRPSWRASACCSAWSRPPSGA